MGGCLGWGGEALCGILAWWEEAGLTSTFSVIRKAPVVLVGQCPMKTQQEGSPANVAERRLIHFPPCRLYLTLVVEM